MGSAAPLRLNRAFLYQRYSLLMIGQLLFGLLATVTTVTCFPNTVFHYCSIHVYDFLQILSLICINLFTLCITGALVIAHALDMPDAYYKCNFHIFEKLFSTLAAVLYAGACIVIAWEVATVLFAPQWILSMMITICTFACYSYDAFRRWKSPENFECLR